MFFLPIYNVTKHIAFDIKKSSILDLFVDHTKFDEFMINF